MVVHSYYEILLVPGIYWTGIDCVVLLANALMHITHFSFEANLLKRVLNDLLEWHLTLILSSLKLELVVESDVLSGGATDGVMMLIDTQLVEKSGRSVEVVLDFSVACTLVKHLSCVDLCLGMEDG